MASLLFAFLVGCAVLGPSVIDPRNIKWLQGDPAQSYLGWAFFRMEDSWKFPLGHASKLNFPDGTPIAYTDSMPILAVAMKAFSRHLPSTFQYLGLVALANYILQAFFGYKIGFALLKDCLLAALASAFFTLAPPFVLRTGFHFSLSSHWLILAGLWLYLRFDQEHASENATVLWFCVLLFVVGGITPYVAILCLMLYLATGLLAFVRECRNWVLRAALWLGPFVVLLISWILFGFLKLNVLAEEYTAPGYRYHSLNILAPLDPQNFPSLFFKDQGVLPGQTEGYSYLGAGMIFLVVTSLIFAPLALFRSKAVSLWPLWLLAVLSFALAASAKITIGSHVLLDLPLPETLERLLSTFRASGRLFWVGYYVVLCSALAAASQIFSRGRLVVVLIALLAVQILDCKSLYARVHEILGSRPASATRLKDPFWKQIGKRFDTLVVVPAFQSQFGLKTYDSPGGDESWRIFGMLAAKQKMAVNTAYLARHEARSLEYHSKTLPEQISSGQLDGKTLCVLSPRSLVRLLENEVTNVFCQTIDGLAVCWKAASQSDENRNSIWNALHEKGYLVSLLDRFAYHPHEITMDLRHGFRLPEGELLFAKGQETQIPLLLDKARPARRIHVNLTPLLAKGDSGQAFSIWIGRHQVAECNLKARSTIAVEIPDEAWTEGIFNRRLIPIIFKWGTPPSSVAASTPPPSPAAFHELRLEY